MRKVSFVSFMAILMLLCVQSIHAKVKLPAIVSSNMVLQRNTTVVLWGWANAKEEITIEASWMNETLKVKADKDGNWRVEVKTTNSKEALSIRLKSKASDILLDNILFGEVWLCSGQSNMQQPVKGYGGQPTYGTLMATAKASNPNLRLFTVNRLASKTPENDVEKYLPWQEASPENVPDFSAVAYYFGLELQEILNVPVGMIHTSWGGSSVQAWISEDVISDFQEVDLADVDISKGTNHIPTALFNAMINPLIPYTIKGALWYQAESNRMKPDNYKELFPAMVKDWRQRWEIGNFPFYYVQIAPYWYNDSETFSGPANSAYIREAQLKCVDLIPNSGIAIAMDIGDQYSIHPPRKKEVADRLLFNALNQTYGFSTVDYAGPVYDSNEEKEGGLVLKFKHAENGLYAFDGLDGFEIAGNDKVFYPAEAIIDKHKTVYVKSENVPNPVAVRYAWDNWLIGTLYDTNLLPASSFRTDEWDDATRSE
ncbi:MAG: sialate O-acetylesterase [Bacteroidales bacterium]|nr:sialate O-acetylesterase [Bacteroidales bacterium]